MYVRLSLRTETFFLYEKILLCNLPSAYREPLLYNAQVAREIVKHIYVAERLSPPLTAEAWKSAYSALFSRAISRSYWTEAAANGQLARVGVYALEAYGIFKVREFS